MESKKITKNITWVIVCKAMQAILQLIIGLLSARYLGPANYGLINYAKSIVAFAVPFMQLGLNVTLVKELIDNPEREGRVMGTSLVIGMVSSIICIISVCGFVSVANAGEQQTIMVCLLYSLSMFFQAIELIQYWFHSKLKSKYPSITMLITYVVVSLYKLFLLVAEKNVYWFAVVYSIEYGIIGFSLLFIYRKQGTQKLRFDFSLIKNLLSKSSPYIWSSLMVTVFQNTDHIMLKFMRGDTVNGYYTAAITCVSVSQFVFTAIIDSVRPVILSNRKKGRRGYEKSLSSLYFIIIYMAMLQGAGFTLFARLIVRILYGEAYLAAIPVLRILVWQEAFSYMGKIRNIWLLAEDKQKYLWKINLAGALTNAAINFVFIPRWGASGAAFASLITQIFTNFVIGFIYKPIEENNRMILHGLNPRMLLELKELKEKG